MQPLRAHSPIIFENWPGLTPYSQGVTRMEERVHQVQNGAPEHLIMCEHEPVFTVGTSGKEESEVLTPGSIPVIHTGRGGKTTYHGPGQIILYPILNLNNRGKDLRAHIQNLQSTIIHALQTWNIHAEARNGDEVGVWVGNDKIAAIGVRVSKWVSYHGIALNINPDLTAFGRIIPCGLQGRGVTSVAALGQSPSRPKVESALLQAFSTIFQTPVSP